MPDIHAVDPHDEPAMRAWFGAFDAGVRAGRTAPLVSGYGAFTYTMRNPGQVRRRLPVAARDGEEVVGGMLLELPLLDDTETFEVEIGVPERHRRRGVGSALWAHALDHVAGDGRTLAQTELSVPVGCEAAAWPGWAFASTVGFETRHVEDHLVFDLPASRSVPTPAGYRLRQWVGPCPDEHVASYAALQTAMNADVPTGGMTRTAVTVSSERVRSSDQRLAQNYLTIVSSAVTDDDEPAGYSLVMVPREDPADVVQDDTLVLRAHRGHGLGTVMKAANLRLLAEHAPDGARLHTWTAQENGPMQAINARFGFRTVETMHEMERRA